MKKNSLKYVVILFLMVFLMPINVFAKGKITLTTDEETLTEGEEIVATAKISGNEKLYSLTATLSYDANVFKTIDDSDFIVDDENINIIYNTSNHQFGIINKSGEIKKQLFKVRLTVKKNANVGKTKIALTNISSSDGKKKTNFQKTISNVLVTRDAKDNETVPTNKENVVKENEQLPKTISTNSIILALIVLIIILLIACFTVIIKKKENKNKIITILNVLIVLLLIIVISLFITNYTKQDVNKDGKKDYKDAEEIIKYIIGIEGKKPEDEEEKTTDTIEENNNRGYRKVGYVYRRRSHKKVKTSVDYDLNGDGYVDVNDVSHVTESTNNKTEVTLRKENENDYYFKKNEVVLKFNATINPSNLKITQVKIGDKYYNVNYTNGVYSVLVNDSNKAGVHNFVIKSVKLSNGEERTVNLSFKKEVLKDVPKVTNLQYNIKNSELKFLINDDDNALKNANITIYEGNITVDDFDAENNDTGILDEDGNEKDPDDFDKFKIVYEKELDITKKDITLNPELELGGVYTVVITSSYDLDSNNDNDKNEYEKVILKDTPYNITIGNITLKPLSNLEELYPKQNEDIEFVFDVDFRPASIKRSVTKVIIDNEAVDVTYTDDNNYKINLEGENTYGIHSHKISAIILDDNTEVLCDYDLKYDVLKEKPEIKNFVYHEDDSRITFNLNDKNSALENAKIKITNDDGEEVFNKTLNVKEKDFEINLDLEKGSKYNVSVTASYDLDSNSTNNKNNGEIEYTHELIVYDITLTNAGTDIYYPKKGEDVDLKFTPKIDPENDKATVNAVIINGKKYVPTKKDDYYFVTIKASGEAGTTDYKFEKIIIDDEEINTELTLTVDVLKDEPTITDLLIDQTTDKITFTLNDEDKALNSKPGSLIIKDKDGKTRKEIDITKGKNEIDLEEFKKELEDEEVYYLDIKVNYDLDSDTGNGLNQVEKNLIEDHVIKFYKVKLSLDSKNKYYVPKNTKVEFMINAKVDDATIKSFILSNNTEINAKELDNNKYSLDIETKDKAGEVTYTIKKVILSNNIEVDASLDIKVEVLKDKPYINKLNVNEDNTSLEYELVDKDNALTDGTITIYDINNEKVKEEKLDKLQTKGKIDYKFKEDQTYTVKVVGSYDLDSKENDGNNEFKDEEISKESFTIGGDYNFTLTNVSITDALKQNEKPIVSFKSSNSRKEIIENAYLTNDDNDESKKYNVTNKSGDNYEILLEDADLKPGVHTVTLDSVGMKNLKVFNNNKDYKAHALTYTVLKEIPKVENFTLKEDKNNKNIDVEFKLVDKDSTCEKLTVALVESNGKIIATQEFNLEDINKDSIKTSLSYDKSTDGRYTVKVLADYELADKYHYTNQNIKEDSILTHTPDDIYIKNMYITNNKNEVTNTIYVNKNEKDIPLALDVFVGDSVKKSKAYARVSGANINGIDFPAYQTKEFLSKVYLNIPNTSGVIELKAYRVQLANDGYYKIYNDYYSVEEKTLKIEVLKDKPQIKNLKVDEDYDKKEVTFDFEVVLDEKATNSEDEFKNGYIELNGIKQNIHRGENSVTFENVEEDTNFDLKFVGSFDLDTDALNENGEDQNTFTDYEFYSVKYGLYNKDTYKNIAIENGKALSKNNDKYFEKNEDINLNFNISGLDDKLETSLEKVVINDKEYSVTTTDDLYNVIVEGYHSSGQKEIKVTDIILNNGKKVKLTKPYTFKLEVLKDAPKIIDYKYEKTDDGIKVTFDLKDKDDSVVDHAKVLITDDKGNKLYNSDYKDEITFKTKEDDLRYLVKITTDYDLDIDKKQESDNYYENKVLLDEVISLEDNNIELKDIVDINLYKKSSNSGYEEISLEDEVEVDELKENKKDYFVEVVMDNLPTVRGKIKKVIDEKTLILELEYENLTQENSKEVKTIRIEFGPIKDNKAKNERHPKDAFKALLKKLESSEEVTLTQNYDASSISTDSSTYVTNEYSGKLNGNGYTIKNLSKPLFNTVKNATIENLNITDVVLGSDGKGALANTVTSSTIEKVLVDKVEKKQTGNGNNGGLIGLADNTEVKSSRATNVVLNLGWLEQQNGTFIGHTQNNTKVTDCYSEGVLSGGWHYTSGFIGNAQRTTITNNYVKVTTRGQTEGATAFGNAYSDNNSVYKNNVCFATGANGNFAGSAKELENNYLFTSNAKENVTGVKNIEEKDINNELFKSKAKFNEKIWKIKDVSVDNLPTFQIENNSVLNDTSSADYKEENETLYYNLQQLMPFYDSAKIIESSKNIKDANLQNKKIKHIIPVDETGNIVTYLTTDNSKKITKLKVVFNDNTKQDYNVSYNKTYDMVATYRINDLGIDYNYNHYVINNNSQIITNLVNYLNDLDYTNNLDILTTNNDSRIYRDFYNETTKNELEEFILKYLSNSNYTNTTDDDFINDYLEKEIKKDKKLEKILYTYNYFRRFYDLDVDGMKVYDFMMFNMEGFDKTLTPDKIASLYLDDKTGSSFNTNETNKRYREILDKYTKLDSIPKLLEYLVNNFSNQKPDEWMRNEFKGILEEIKIDNHEDIKYTLWSHFITDTRDEILNQFLPILTLPENSAYILSMPVQYVIGSQRTYIANPDNPNDALAFKEKISTYVTRYKRYFETAYSILQDKKLFNDILIYHVDKRHTKTESGATLFNTPYTTEEPFHKNFVEVTGLWAAAAGNNAAAWGPRVEWQVAGVLDSTLAQEGYNDTSHVTFRTWSHESAHVIDARLFLKNNGRRFDAGGEDYADCFLMQSFGQNDITMNISMLLQNDKDKVASNLTPDRINSKSKIEDFYKKLFKTVYVMDYIESQAFLQLSKEEQKALGVQISYPNEDLEVTGTNTKYKDDPYAKFRARQTTKYTRLNELPDFNKELKTIDDLIDNRIMLYPGIYKNASKGSNLYGGEGINTVHWYQPNNPDGRPDSYSLKWISYEMLGYKGYDDGFVEYASNINSVRKPVYKSFSNPKDGTSEVDFKSDSMALKKITNTYSNFSDYKKARFNEVKANLEKLDADINVKEYVQKFYESLKEDAKDITTGVDELLTRRPGCVSDYWCSRQDLANLLGFKNSTKLRQEIYYKLKNKTNDFTTDIYMKEKQQDVDDLTVDKKEVEGKETKTIESPFEENEKIEKPKAEKEQEDTMDDKPTTDEKATPPTTPESTPANPNSTIVEEQKSEEKQGLQQDDPTNTTNTVGPEPDTNPDSVQTNAIVLPVS